MHRSVATFPATIVVAALALSFSSAAAPAESASERSEAEALYAQGRYAEALSLLEGLDAAGQATGALLYRLAYCQRGAGNASVAAETERRALESLERESAAANDLEVSFYLVNTYQNAGRAADVRRVAAEATAAVEGGRIPRPSSGAGMFQLGKLYADQERADLAAEWYAKAVGRLTSDPHGERSYLRWASRFLGERAFRAGGFEEAARHLGLLLDEGEATALEIEKLAVSRARAGQYTGAADAWALAEIENPASADRFRYCSRLARLAGELESVPTQAPVGKPWAALTQAELEAVMKEQSDEAKQILAEVQQREEFDESTRDQFRTRLAQPKALFVSAGLEYALRGYPIRETSFFGGYAPLILKPTAWRVRAKDGKKRKQQQQPTPRP